MGKMGFFDTENVDEKLATVMQTCSTRNKTLQVLRVHGSWRHRSHEALGNAISRWESLKEFSTCERGSSPLELLLHVGKLHKLAIGDASFQGWGLLPRGMQASNGNNLQVLDLSGSKLSADDLGTILPCLSSISELYLNNCGISDREQCQKEGFEIDIT